MAAIEPEYLPSGTERILLVDDDSMMRSLGTTLLEHLGYTVLTAADGAEGLEMYRSAFSAVELVILDLMLPLLSGAEVLAAIRAINPDARVIITSGHGPETARKILGDSGPLHFVTKPCDIQELVQTVREVLDE